MTQEEIEQFIEEQREVNKSLAEFVKLVAQTTETQSEINKSNVEFVQKVVKILTNHQKVLEKKKSWWQ